jgi:hypothetical protein
MCVEFMRLRTTCSTLFETRTATPMATTSSGTSGATTAPAPMTLREPTLPPGRTAAPRQLRLAKKGRPDGPPSVFWGLSPAARVSLYLAVLP